MESSSSIRAVVFDLGGVLIDWNPRYLYWKIFDGDAEKMEWFLANVCTPDWNSMQDAGRTFEEATTVLVRRHPEHEELIRAYYNRWEEMIDGPIDGSVEILRQVRESPHALYGLTNWSAESFPVARERFEFLGWFEGILVSGDIGMIKPDPEIFHYLTRAFELEPSATVFIDDSVPNVETADELGFQAVRFVDAEQLRQDLLRLGVQLETR